MNLFENIIKKIKLHEELNINDYGIYPSRRICNAAVVSISI